MSTRQEEIVKFAKKLISSGLTSGTGGNISVIDREKALVAVTPSGVDYDQMKPNDIVVVNMDGKVVSGNNKPTSELNFHLALYKKREDIGSVVHTHSVYATTFAVLGWEIMPAHYMTASSGAERVPLIPYETFGTKELADAISENIKDYNAALLENHGLVAVGKNLTKAFTIAEDIEFAARVYYQAKCIGEPKILTKEQMKPVLKKFKDYGRK